MGSDFDSWRWQLRNRIRTKEQLEKYITLTPEEIKGIEITNKRGLGLNITPYYAELMENDPNDPIRRSIVPLDKEGIIKRWELKDPVGEDKHMVVPGLVHRYPDRVLLLLTDMCAGHCRYCTRRRLVGKKEKAMTWTRFGEVLKYIKSHKEIRDVVVSGGDPLVLPNNRIDRVLKSLRSIEHIEIIRIGTKVPVFLPQRITSSLCNVLKKYHPLYISINFMHYREITAQVAEACMKLADAGIPLGSQTVLLKGINDDLETMKKLMHQLLTIRVKPYYIYQCDLAQGIDHFRTPIQTGLDIIKGLRGWTSGYAVPTFVLDTPTGGGKVPLSPNYIKKWERGKIEVYNYKEKVYEYQEVD